jgi:hypothetical protein
MTRNCVASSQFQRDLNFLRELVRAEYRARRARILLPIWPYFAKCFPFPSIRIKLIHFLVNYKIDLEMRIH